MNIALIIIAALLSLAFFWGLPAWTTLSLMFLTGIGALAAYLFWAPPAGGSRQAKTIRSFRAGLIPALAVIAIVTAIISIAGLKFGNVKDSLARLSENKEMEVSYGIDKHSLKSEPEMGIVSVVAEKTALYDSVTGEVLGWFEANDKVLVLNLGKPERGINEGTVEVMAPNPDGDFIGGLIGQVPIRKLLLSGEKKHRKHRGNGIPYVPPAPAEKTAAKVEPAVATPAIVRMVTEPEAPEPNTKDFAEKWRMDMGAQGILVVDAVKTAKHLTITAKYADGKEAVFTSNDCSGSICSGSMTYDGLSYPFDIDLSQNSGKYYVKSGEHYDFSVKKI